MARSSALVAEERGLSPQGQVPRTPYNMARYCRAIIAAPTAEMVTDAQEFFFRCLEFSAGYAASALSLLGTIEERCEEVRSGRRTMVQALQVIDACSRLPARFLLARGHWENSTVREVLVVAIRHAAVLLASLERAAAELGMEPFDGGPFALGAGTPRLEGAR